MATKRVKVFIEHLERFLLNPDIPPPCATEPVYEAGSWAIHMFFDKGFQTQVKNEWNATHPYYMGDWLIDPSYCFSEPSVRLPGEDRGMNRNERYLHLSLHQIGLDYRIDYGNTMFFASVAAMVGANAYRAGYDRAEIIHQLMRGDLETPSISEAQLNEYLALSRQFAWVHMNPSAFQQPSSIVPAYENGAYGLHVFHPDPAVLELMRILHQLRCPGAVWGGTGPCPVAASMPFLHFNLRRIDGYLADTPFFTPVRGR